MEIKISVIIPVFNCEKYISNCIDSIVTQTIEDIEIIIIDDGSRDNTRKLLQKYELKDKRIKIYSQTNQGPGPARNKGITVARGKYIIFIDADDYLENNMLELLYNCAEENKTEVTICKSKFCCNNNISSLYWAVDESLIKNDSFNPMELKEYFFQFCRGWPWDKLFLTRLIKTTGIIYPNLYNSQDLSFVYPLMMYSKRVGLVRKELIVHRINVKSSVSNSRDKKPFCFMTSLEILKKYVDESKDVNLRRSFINWALEYSLWNMDTLHIIQKIRVYNKLKREEFKKLEISSDYGPDWYYDKKNYERLLNIEKTPVGIYLLKKLMENNENVKKNHHDSR